jgi:hypothetical protein
MARRTAEAGSAGVNMDNGRRGPGSRSLTKADLLEALTPLKTALRKHEDRMEMMELTIKRIAQADTLGTRVENGLCEIAEKLKPLESLRASSIEPAPLKDADKKNLGNLKGSLKRAEWSNATSIPVPNKPVPFVGQTPTRQGSSKP